MTPTPDPASSPGELRRMAEEAWTLAKKNDPAWSIFHIESALRQVAEECAKECEKWWVTDLAGDSIRRRFGLSSSPQPPPSKNTDGKETT